MAIRETSAAAYETIKENGLLSEKRFRVYSILFHNGPLIGSEVARIYKELYGRTSNSETIRNRLTELRDSGAAFEAGRAIDKNTGMKVILWDVTSKLPVRPEKMRKEKCEHCDGKGFVESKQRRLF